MNPPLLGGTTLRILSVEDHPDMRKLLNIFLEKTCKLTFAIGAGEALDVLDEASYNLLLVDINLGKAKSGVDLLRAIRERHSADTLSAIAVTVDRHGKTV